MLNQNLNCLREIIYWSPAKTSEISRALLGSSDKAKDQQKICPLQKGVIKKNIFLCSEFKEDIFDVSYLP